MDLIGLYRLVLERCSPSVLTRDAIARAQLSPGTVDVVAMGKCAAGLLEGARQTLQIDRSFAAVPAGYPRPHAATEIVEGSHPAIDARSFAAGSRLVSFVRQSKRPVVFLISGGSSACVEQPLAPWFSEEDLIGANAALVRSGLPIASINTARKHLSAIKGGRLGAMVAAPFTFILSDVSRGNERDVGSGPTVPDHTTNEDAARVLESIGSPLAAKLREVALPETPKQQAGERHRLIADNGTLVSVAARIAEIQQIEEEMNGDVAAVARRLHSLLLEKDAFAAGGEPTVVVRGNGRGGRCSELAVRFARECAREPLGEVHALFASSDGSDGNSGSAGFVLSLDSSSSFDEAAYQLAVQRSDTFGLAAAMGVALPMLPTGNNLRDLFVLARNSHG